MTKKAQRIIRRSTADRLRWLFLAAYVALWVATPLLPSEVFVAKGPVIIFVMLWLVLFVGWSLAAATESRPLVRWGATTIAVGIFLAWYSIAALGMASQGQPRLTLNALWQWLTFGLLFFLGRQLVQTERECRALLAVAVAVAVLLSSFGYYQYGYSMPKTRQLYESNPELALARANVVAPPGSPERAWFENRLYSTEPLGTFSLTNSLAGFLTPWLLVATGCVLFVRPQGAWPRYARWVRLGFLLLIAGCWLLTKSRTAWLATGVGGGLLLLYGRPRGWRPDGRLLAAAAAGLLIVLVATLVGGGLDWLVIAESSKALQYRLEYWQASAALIRDFPLLGAGPGNFQQYYSAYKLPGASETVADPHNFLFEVAAASGLAGLASFLGILVCFGWQLQRPSPPAPDPQPHSGTPFAESMVPVVYWGAFAGGVLAFPVGMMSGLMPELALVIWGAPMAALALAAWHPWVMDGTVSTSVVVVAVTALLLNLFAAGGIGFAGVANSFWLLLALGLTLNESGQRPRSIPQRGAVSIAVGALLLTVLAYVSTYRPVLRADEKLAEGRFLRSQHQTAAAEDAFLEAARRDPYDAMPWREVAPLRLERFAATGRRRDLDRFAEAAETLVRLHPRSSRIRLDVGNWWLTAYRLSNDRRQLRQATAAYRAAVELYPNDSFSRAQLAWSLHLAGDSEAAGQVQTALQLDEQNPHQELALARRRVFDPGPLPGKGGLAGPGQRDAEQAMQLLRSQYGH